MKSSVMSIPLQVWWRMHPPYVGAFVLRYDFVTSQKTIPRLLNIISQKTIPRLLNIT